MKILFVLALVNVTLLLSVCLAGCLTSEARQAAVHDLAATVADATADGAVTPEELRDIAAKMKAVGDTPSFDWGALLTTAGGSVLAALLGVRYIPTSVFQGPFDKKKAQPA